MRDADDWHRLSDLFERASALDDGARAALLEEVARADPSLAQTLARMLAAADGAHRVLDDGPALVHALIAPAEVAPPTHIGAYRVLRLLGEGGMGRVYLVERTLVGGQAALKLLRDAWVSPARLARFTAEQRTLAQLSHPGIAQLYDLGALADGTPWFVMEYVEGAPITRHAADAALSVAERLALMADVCRAVQHAHAHAVIHRDLKPSNVLVTPTGDVKLLDFGIAKQLDLEGEKAEQTRTGLRMLTPAYAAPEQFTGAPLGVRTDVHALGVMLYELLTGRLPWSDASGADPDPLAGRHRDVPRPSSFATSGEAAPGRAAWKELDVLVQTAMHQDPERRYASVEALGRDIAHYLAQEPLDARPDTWRYRLGRLTRRRWRELAAAATVLVAVVSLSVAYGIGVTRARDTALRESSRRERIQSFMLGLFKGGDGGAGPADTLRVRTLLARGVQEAEALEAEPEVRAELLETLGEIRRQLGEFASSDTLLRRTLAERERVLGPRHPDVARALLALGRLRIDEARLDAADTLVRRTRAIVEGVLPAGHPVVVEALATAARLEQERARYDDAIALQTQVVERRRADPTSQEFAGAVVELANSHFYAGHLDASDSLNRVALGIYRSRLGDRHPLVADVLVNLGAAEFERGRYAEAERLHRDALERVRAWYGEEHPATASGLTLVGRALVRQDRDAEADSVLREAVVVQERAHGPVHPKVASALNELGTIALRANRLDDAERYFRRNASIYTRLYGTRHWLLGIAQSNLGSVAMARQQPQAAERFLRQALAQFSETQGPEHLNTAIAYVKLGRALLRQSRYHEAAAASQKGYDLLVAREAAPASFLDAARSDLAAAYDHLGDKERARTFAAARPK